MNRFNLFFVFLLTLISSALRYSIQDGEKIEAEVKELIQSGKDYTIYHEPQKTIAVENELVPDTEIECTVK